MGYNFPKYLLIFVILFILHMSSTSAQSCSHYKFASNRDFSTCNDLPYLNSYLHWTHNPSSRTLEIAFRRTSMPSSRWVAWAINPSSLGMVGSQALVAFQKSDGTMRAYTSHVTSYRTGLEEGDLSFSVSNLSATYSNSEITIFATLKLQNFSSSSTVNQVWQEGPVSNDSPGMHPMTGPNVQSMGSLNLLSGEAKAAGGVGKSKINKNIHGVLNTISWGILMPLGAIIARYIKLFPCADPAWFYLHVCCQLSAYIIGVAGFSTGLQLGSQSPGVTYVAHKVIGIVLFCFATIQILVALFLRPKKDHKYRIYWNVCHYLIGYSILILSIFNIFKGLHILNPNKKWEIAYVVILAILASLAAILEIITWIIVLRRKKSQSRTNEVLSYGAMKPPEIL